MENDLQAISKAINLIKDGLSVRIDLGSGLCVYKVPSGNPAKYTIRIDIKVNLEED